MQVTLNCSCRLQDNGDGGYTMYIYNNDEELLADHPLSEDGELTEEKKREILNGDDEYTNGYVSHRDIVLEVEHDMPIGLVQPSLVSPPKIRLAKPIHIHAGQ